MKTPQKTIAVLIEPGATVSDLLPQLRKTFNEKARIITISGADIRHRNILDKIDALIIPGVSSKSSSYRNSLMHDGGGKIKDWVKQGGTVLGFCQGAYLLTEKFQYADKISGVTHIIHSPCGIFKGMAHGPIREYTDRNDLHNRYADHRVAKLEFNDAARGASCYVHGPWLEPAQDEKIKIIARYAEIPGKPVAIAVKTFGKGKAIFCGVEPDVTGFPTSTMDEKNVSAGKDAQMYRTAVRFARELAKEEPLRKLTWDRVIAELKI